MREMAIFTSVQLRAIADALGDTSAGLTGSELEQLLDEAGIEDVDHRSAKRHRLNINPIRKIDSSRMLYF